MDFPSPTEEHEVATLLGDLAHKPLNVGHAQLCRSILVLADGNVERVRMLCRGLMGDPRDVIMAAEHEAGDPGHFFIHPFST